MPAQARCSQHSEAAKKTWRKNKKNQQAENAASQYELRQRVCAQYFFGTQVQTKPACNAKHQPGDCPTNMIHLSFLCQRSPSVSLYEYQLNMIA
jgi:hypothetical protein